MKKDGRRGARWGLAGVLVAMLLIVPAHAGGKGSEKMDGGINPTNTVVIESDLDTVSMKVEEPVEMYPLAQLTLEEQIRSGPAHEIATGRGVVVAVLDGGFNLRHPWIAANVSPFGYDAIDLDGDPNDVGDGVDEDCDGVPDSALGHGTFVAGMVLRAAPDATILPIRVRDDEGLGTNDELIRGIEYAIAMRVDVMNLSLTDAAAKKSGITKAINSARDAGIVVVTAAGNDGLTYVPRLATNWGTICVGAVDSCDRIADFSNYTTSDAWLMIFAPGVDLEGPVGYPSDDSIGYWSGTSFAAGIISGAAALVCERHPEFGPIEVGETLRPSVDPVWTPEGMLLSGIGRIDLYKAVLR